MLVDKLHITSFLPQRDPIVMIDNLLECDEKCSVTNFTIRQNDLFVQEERFLDAGVFENIAQTALAGSNFQSKKNNSAPERAFLGEIKLVKIAKQVRVGNLLKTKTTIIKQALGITLIQGEVYCQNELIAECQMKLIISNE